MKKVLFYAIIIIALFANAKAYFPPDSCLKVYTDDDDYKNPFGVKVDSCYGSPTYMNQFGAGCYLVEFKYSILPQNLTTNTSTFTLYNLSDIKSEYSWIKDSLTTFSIEYGTFTLKYGELGGTDTSFQSFRQKTFVMNFTNIHNFKEVSKRIKQFTFNNAPVKSIHELTYHTSYKSENNEYSFVKISPNPSNNELLIELNGESQPKSVAILDEKGKEILISEFKSRIDINKLSTGIYFLKINNKLFKFIKGSE